MFEAWVRGGARIDPVRSQTVCSVIYNQLNRCRHVTRTPRSIQRSPSSHTCVTRKGVSVLGSFKIRRSSTCGWPDENIKLLWYHCCCVSPVASDCCGAVPTRSRIQSFPVKLLLDKSFDIPPQLFPWNETMNGIPSRSLANFPHILHDVFTFLDPAQYSLSDDAAYESRDALVMSARACHGFTALALKVLWRHLPDDQPLADLLCILGIATRGHELEPEKLEGQCKPQRYRLPTLEIRDSADYAALAAYQRRWKRLRGYDVAYVSTVFL